MSADARISIGLPSHPKTKKLIRRLGQASAWNLVCLFLWAAGNKSDGDLSGMTDEDIELSADWCGEDGAFVSALVDVQFIDGESGGYSIHDWSEHNPWAAGSTARSLKARWNAAKGHHGVAEADRLVPEYAAIRNASSTATSTATSKLESDTSIAPSLLLSVSSPSPKESEVKTLKPDAQQVETLKPKRKTRLPDSFQFTPELGELATDYWVSKGRNDLLPADEFEKFRTYHTSHGKPMLDWDACWRTWYMNAITFNKPQFGVNYENPRTPAEHKLAVSRHTFDYEKAIDF